MKTLILFVGIIIMTTSCRKEQIVPSKSCKDCSNNILINDSIFDSLFVDTMWRRNEVREVQIINDCLQPIIWIEQCELTCSQYLFYAKKNTAENYYDIKWEILNDEICITFTGGELMPINISALQDSTKNEVFLKLYDYDEIISYKY